MADRNDFLVPPTAQPSPCRSCGAACVWITTAAGKYMLLDLATEQVRDGRSYAESHFAHCQNATQHRRKPQKGQP